MAGNTTAGQGGFAGRVERRIVLLWVVLGRPAKGFALPGFPTGVAFGGEGADVAQVSSDPIAIHWSRCQAALSIGVIQSSIGQVAATVLPIRLNWIRLAG